LALSQIAGKRNTLSLEERAPTAPRPFQIASPADTSCKIMTDVEDECDLVVKEQEACGPAET